MLPVAATILDALELIWSGSRVGGRRPREGDAMSAVTELSARAVHAAMKVLHRLSTGEGLAFTEVWERVQEIDPTLKTEWDEEFPDLATNARTKLRYVSISLVKAGWLSKTGRRWQLTGPGRQAFTAYEGDRDALLARSLERYGYWSTERLAFDQAADVLEMLPDSHQWVATADLAEAVGLEEEPLRSWIQAGRMRGWHLALGQDGEVPEQLELTEREYDDWRTLLEESRVYDITASGGRAVRAKLNRRLPTEQLTELVAGQDTTSAKPELPRRAWLIPGTDLAGLPLIRSLWRDKDVCTLSADRLPTLGPETEPKEVREIVDTYYTDLSQARRSETAASFHAFLWRMKANDIVITTDGDLIYLGEVGEEEATQAVTGDGTVLQRPVQWVNVENPLTLDDLPRHLTGPLGNPNVGLLELSEFTADLEVLLDQDPSRTPSGSVADAELPDATQELADKLTMPDPEWLQECVELLRDRPQLILYGPPGTGKTYTALALARHLTGGRQANVRLVQFHPAYSYEDFFEGFRPRAVPLATEEGNKGAVGSSTGQGRPPGGSADGRGLSDAGSGIVFDLVPGPLKTLAEDAEKSKGETFVLVIDEINRGHLAKVFGELYFLLEYRKEFVHLLYGSDEGHRFRLPPNLVIIGTMNTTDRSIALMDAAMRRRFSFMELHPARKPVKSFLADWLENKQLPPDAATLLDALNARIEQVRLDDRDFRIGPSYFMRSAVHTHAKGLDRVWRHQILPLLKELHWGDDVDVEAEYGLDVLREETGLTTEAGDGAVRADVPAAPGAAE
ncbi:MULTISPECIES: McrB family protein [unclassified Streptomyces]|uniref:McrB family protein n=1 Tax=unclassified Streptomyces TaxID=2593676 RepID=UPI0037F37891